MACHVSEKSYGEIDTLFYVAAWTCVCVCVCTRGRHTPSIGYLLDDTTH